MTTTEILTYEFRVDGLIDDHWSGWLDGLTLARHDDGTTTLAGPVLDQAQLHGLLARLRDMGVTLVSLQVLGDGVPMDGVPVTERPQTPENPLLGRPVRTRRLTLRAGTAEDTEETFAYLGSKRSDSGCPRSPPTWRAIAPPSPTRLGSRSPWSWSSAAGSSATSC